MSARPTREISLEERRYENGREPAIADIMRITFVRPEPEHHQTENHLIHEQYYWKHRGTVSWSKLQAAVEDPGGPLWLNGNSSLNGINDRVAEDEAAQLRRSLYLVRPSRLRLVVAAEGASVGPARRRVRADFELCGHPYRLVVTDPRTERPYLGGDDGEYSIAQALLCISLSESYHSHAYKLVAAVITADRVGAIR